MKIILSLCISFIIISLVKASSYVFIQSHQHAGCTDTPYTQIYAMSDVCINGITYGCEGKNVVITGFNNFGACHGNNPIKPITIPQGKCTPVRSVGVVVGNSVVAECVDEYDLPTNALTTVIYNSTDCETNWEDYPVLVVETTFVNVCINPGGDVASNKVSSCNQKGWTLAEYGNSDCVGKPGQSVFNPYQQCDTSNYPSITLCK
ncbi:hypothetical protein DFA_10570 [Cavenderia fasciculata]|uniref:Secreted protein n=1 Tax=Cavenderia fasciculata TaxID=261658 RepID=F4QAK9_CACFS|nr:uncharacterized protein DFA_10570 [Cavenderia fasciculata]EGG15728.1 hypothetical protein DFA_10570 [Cavenderia fasciculata]|eukprot:XP_004354470.1 hypothetical protein DFA_10570 [Cavenderia fasciculata]